MNDDLDRRVYRLELLLDQLTELEKTRDVQLNTKVDILTDRVEKNEAATVAVVSDVKQTVVLMKKDVWSYSNIVKAMLWLAGIIVAGSALTVIALVSGISI